MIEFKVPRLNSNSDQVDVRRWLAAAGARVEKDTLVVTIESDKVSLDVPAPAAGFLDPVAADMNQRNVGDVLFRLFSTADEYQRRTPVPLVKPVFGTPGARVTAAALALAAEAAFDLSSIQKRGIITREDVEQALGVAKRSTGAQPGTARRIEPDATHRAMIERIRAAQSSKVPATCTIAMNAGPALAWLAAEKDAGRVFVLSDVILWAMGRAARRFERLHSVYRAGGIELYPDVHIGMTVDHQGRLYTPVIHHADRLSVNALAVERRRVIMNILRGRIAPEDLDGAAITYTALDAPGVVAQTAIIPPEQSAILAIGGFRPGHQPGDVEVHATLSYDHQVVAGKYAADYLLAVAAALLAPDAAAS